MIKEIIHDQFFLAKKAQKATPADKQVIIDLLDTLRANQASCVGLAANMIGSTKRIIVCQAGPLALALVNPEIIQKSEAYQTTEGCLSLSGQRKTTRYQKITVRYWDQNFQEHTKKFSGFLAQIIQHEIDHCEGILI